MILANLLPAPYLRRVSLATRKPPLSLAGIAVAVSSYTYKRIFPEVIARGKLSAIAGAPTIARELESQRNN